MKVSNLRRIGALAVFSAFISMGYVSAHAEAGAASAPATTGATSPTPEGSMAHGPRHGEKAEAMCPKMKKRCDAEPQKCAEIKERMSKHREEVRAACEKEPQRCKEIRQEHREKMRDQLCKENPAQCEKMKARHEAMQKKCAADPKKCEEMKAKHRAKMKERHEAKMVKQAAEPTAATVPSVPAAASK